MDLDGPVYIPSNSQNGISLEVIPNGGRFRIRDAENNFPVELAAALNVAVLTLGTTGFNGSVSINNAAGQTMITVSGRDGDIVLNDESGHQAIRLSGPLGKLYVPVLDITGGADIAENFRLGADADIEPGTVLVITDEEQILAPSMRPFDSRVAGIVSGGGGLPAGVTLAASRSGDGWVEVALAGRVQCLAEASERPIRPGDLLTTSVTPGHAMACPAEHWAPGVILGKALTGLAAGMGLVTALVSLQ